MCLPLLATGGIVSALTSSTALTVASLAATAAGVGISASGQKKQAEYQARIQERNAELARMQAEDARSRGREEETRHRMAVIQQAGRARAALGASGVSLASGTPASLLEDIHFMGELDAMTIRENAAREAWGYEAQAGGYTAEAGLSRTAGRYNTAGTLLAGAGTVADTWYQYRNPRRQYYATE